MERRVFIAILLSLGILFLWQSVGPKLFPDWFPKPPKPVAGAVDGGVGAAANTAKAAKGPADGGAPAKIAAAPGAKTPTKGTPGAGTPGATAPGAAAQQPKVAAAIPKAAPEQQVTLSNDVVRATFTSHGAALSHWVLLDKQFTEEKNTKKQIDLVSVEKGQAHPFATKLAGLGWPTDAAYQVVKKTDRSVTFEASAGGVTVRKTYTLTKSRYDLGLSLAMTNTGTAPRTVTPTLELARHFVPPKNTGGFLAHISHGIPDIVQASCSANGKVERKTHEKKLEPYSHTGNVDWVGLESRYFLTAVFPGTPAFETSKETVPASTTCTVVAPTKEHYQAKLELAPFSLAAGAHQSVRLTGYLGPKFRERLLTYGHHLDDSIDFGFFTLLSLLLLGVLTFLQHLVKNWGVAIIALTVLTRIVLFPLTSWSMKSMEKMKLIQPKMKELKAKYGKDQSRFQQEMMKLYKEEGVSPFGGCLPMLIQLPILFALYEMILRTAELYHAPFIHGWLADLSAPEPGWFKILPIAMGVTMFFMQKMQPMAATGDDTQAKMQKFMMYFMPPFFVFIMYSLPSGVTLYWFVSNALSIAQQLYIRKKQQQAAAAAAA